MVTAPKGFAAGRVLSPGPHFVVFEASRARDARERAAHAGEGDPAAFVCKRLSKRWLRDESAWALLRSEARLLEKLGGGASPRLEAQGDDAHGPYVVMRKVEASPLAERIAAPPADRPAWAAKVAVAAFDALARIHEAADESGTLAVVHGDVRPENLALSGDAPAVTVLDFGLASWRDAPPRDTSTFRGSLAYAAPEAARGEPLDARADLFSLGVSLLEAAAGSRPRAAGSEAALLLAAAESPIDAWARAAAESLAIEVGAALEACVAYQREDRPASAREVLARLVLRRQA
jgi:serine/threonine protein kinase